MAFECDALTRILRRMSRKAGRPPLLAVNVIPSLIYLDFDCVREEGLSQAKKYNEYVRDCLRQAERAETAERREKLIALARVWMNAASAEEEAAARISHSTWDEARVSPAQKDAPAA